MKVIAAARSLFLGLTVAFVSTGFVAAVEVESIALRYGGNGFTGGNEHLQLAPLIEHTLKTERANGNSPDILTTSEFNLSVRLGNRFFPVRFETEPSTGKLKAAPSVPYDHGAYLGNFDGGSAFEVTQIADGPTERSAEIVGEIEKIQALAKAYDVNIMLGTFWTVEDVPSRDGVGTTPAIHNSLAVIDRNGDIIGVRNKAGDSYTMSPGASIASQKATMRTYSLSTNDPDEAQTFSMLPIICAERVYDEFYEGTRGFGADLLVGPELEGDYNYEAAADAIQAGVLDPRDEQNPAAPEAHQLWWGGNGLVEQYIDRFGPGGNGAAHGESYFLSSDAAKPYGAVFQLDADHPKPLDEWRLVDDPAGLDPRRVKGWSYAKFEINPVSIPGDYNNDGIVDAADYTVWRDRMADGAPLVNEGASAGVVDELDYVLWRDNYGQRLTAGVPQRLAIPEPTSAAMLVGFGLAMVSRAAGLHLSRRS